MNKKVALNYLRDIEHQIRIILQNDCSFNDVEWLHLYNVVDSLSAEILFIEKGAYKDLEV